MDSTTGFVRPVELDEYLAELDRTLPRSLIAGVYLTGSAALGDYHPYQSDLDILTLTQSPLTVDEIRALERMHVRLDKGVQPHLDAEYVPRDCVGQRAPEGAAGHAHVVDGEFKQGAHGLELIQWATLAQCGVSLRGPEATSWNAAPDAAVLRAWNLENLASYWRPNFADRARAALKDRDPDSELSPVMAVWVATGPGRLHCTIATGAIISKTAATDYTAQAFPSFAPLLMRAKASRLGDESVAFVARDGLALADLVHELCDDAERLAAQHS